MHPDNIRPVLEILECGEKIRQAVAKRFFDQLKEAFNRRIPKEKEPNLQWVFGNDRTTCFWWNVSPEIGSPANQKCLIYSIDLGIHKDGNLDYLGFGLAWGQRNAEFETDCGKPAIQNLKNILANKKGKIEKEANAYTLWSEYFEQDSKENPWAWILDQESVLNGSEYNKWIDDFWQVVQDTLAGVQQYNSETKA